MGELKNKKFRPEFCQDIVDHMSNGKSLTSFSALLYDKYGLMTCKKTLYNWMKRYPEFEESVEVGRTKALTFFETMLVSAMTGTMPEILKKKESSGINMTAVIFALKTRFFKEYGDKSKIDLSSSDGTMASGFNEEQRKAIAQRIIDGKGSD